MSGAVPKLNRALARMRYWLKRNKRDPLDCGAATPEPELARFGSLRLTPRRIVQSYSWQQSTAPLSRIVRVDVSRVHTRTWLLVGALCFLIGWGLDEWQDFDPFFLAGASAAAVALLFYLLSRRTRLTIRLEDGSTMQVAVRNKHFTLASQFANVVCRVSTHWEPRDLTPNKEPRVAPRLTKSSAASLEIEDDELDDDWESDSTSETMSAETRSSPPPSLQVELPNDAVTGDESDDMTEEHAPKEEPTVQVKRPPAGWARLPDSTDSTS